MHRPKNQPTHEDREKAFERIFGSVRADSGGTGMGSNDEERDITLKRLSFDQLPLKPTEFELPEVKPPVAEHPNLMDDLSTINPSKETKPLQLDEKTKAFVSIFDHVTSAQSTAYGGQSVQPDAQISFPQLPDKTEEQELPEVKPVVPQRDFLKEEQEEREQSACEKSSKAPSERYSKAHDTYVKIFGEMEDQN
eukprot:g1560.t1